MQLPLAPPLLNLAYESDERVRDSSVRKLVKHPIVGFVNLEEAQNNIGDDTPLEGHLLIAFHGLHALVLILPDQPAFVDLECYTHLVKGQYGEVQLVGASYVHLRFKNIEPRRDETDEHYVVEWQDVDAPHMTLGFYQRLFYVCDLNGKVSKLDLMQAAIAEIPEFLQHLLL